MGRPAVAVFLFALLLHPLAAALQPPAEAKVVTEDSPEGLKKLFEELLAATERKDEAALRRLVQSLKLPRHAEWAKARLGEKYGAAFAAEYDKMLPIFDKEMTKVLEGRLKEKQFKVTTGQADPKEEQALLSRFKPPTPLYWVRMTEPDKPMGYRMYWFVHEEGTFRFVAKLQVLK